MPMVATTDEDRTNGDNQQNINDTYQPHGCKKILSTVIALNPESTSCYSELRKWPEDELWMMKGMSLMMDERQPPIPGAISGQFWVLRSKIDSQCPLVEDGRSMSGEW